VEPSGTAPCSTLSSSSDVASAQITFVNGRSRCGL
jgi:hypothetical protein